MQTKQRYKRNQHLTTDEIPPCNGTLIYETILKALFQQNQKYANQIENSVIEQYLNFEIQIFKKTAPLTNFCSQTKKVAATK